MPESFRLVLQIDPPLSVTQAQRLRVEADDDISYHLHVKKLTASISKIIALVAAVLPARAEVLVPGKLRMEDRWQVQLLCL
jgi:hypothetical protein